MFFYISFLRPPPTQSSPSTPIHITPQISNDLRTEPYTDSQDIYYSWAPYPQPAHPPPPSLPPQPTSPTQYLKTTRPIKLTTYRPSSLFKEIPVPPPLGVRENQQWQLILSATPSKTPNYIIDLGESNVGHGIPFPVISMPVVFSAKGVSKGGGGKKQERVERIYRFSNGRAGGEESGNTEVVMDFCDLKITEQTSFDLDKNDQFREQKIWDSGIGLSSWLAEFKASDQNRLGEPLDILWDGLFSSEARHIIELGAGTGIVSLTLASLRNSLSHLNSPTPDKVIATDLESAVPLLNHNISSNHSLYPTNTPQADILDWDEEELPESVTSLGSIDVILMSDVTYNTDSFPALLSTTSKLLRIGDKPPVILLGYKERHEAERSLWSMMESIGVRLEKIGQRRGFADPPVEIWFGRVFR
ncbi:hypothetical protein D9756_002622 [Leucocoprinus leucothites]|uniref:Methyltransferase-domain-containing protein n=1 Tax=Leucocoprinus leucothites TaxID=201217 RepID=A0A8H5GBM5_9AGAR|nr:hypothetical protein D9756_002622 [Leucoagaricus leucothites]